MNMPGQLNFVITPSHFDQYPEINEAAIMHQTSTNIKSREKISGRNPVSVVA